MWRVLARLGKVWQGKINMFKPKGEKPLWKMVFDFVTPMQIGDVVTYEELTEAVGQDITTNRAIVYAANKHLLKDQKRLLVVERSIGYKLVDGMDIMYHAEDRQSMAKRQVRLANFETNNISTIKLTSEEKKKLQDFMSFNANIRAAFAQKIDRIEKANQVTQLAQQFSEQEIVELKELLKTK